MARSFRRGNHLCDCSLTFCPGLHTPLFSSLSGLLELTVPFSEDLAVSALHLVLWRDIPDGAVQAIGIVMLFEAFHKSTGILQRQRAKRTNIFPLQALMPSLDLAIAPRVVRGSPHMTHPSDPDELLKSLAMN